MSKSAETDMGEVVPEGTMLLPVALDANEVAKLAVESAKASIAYKVLDEERKETAAGYAARLKTLDLRVQKLSEQIERQSREEYVRVREVVEGSKVSIYREDTGELVMTREATDLERQPSLPVEGTGHVAIDSDGIERELSAKQAERFRDARAKGKAFTVTIDGAKVRLTHFKGELALNLAPEPSPVPPPPAAPELTFLGYTKDGNVVPLTEEQAKMVRRFVDKREIIGVDILGQHHDIIRLGEPGPLAVGMPGHGADAVAVDGTVHHLSEYWAMMARTYIRKQGRAYVRADGQTLHVIALQPCAQCGAADGHHRTEGHADRTPVEPVPEAVDNFDLTTDPEAEADAEADTEAVAMAMAEQQELVPTRPRRGRKPKQSAAGVQ